MFSFLFCYVRIVMFVLVVFYFLPSFCHFLPVFLMFFCLLLIFHHYRSRDFNYNEIYIYLICSHVYLTDLPIFVCCFLWILSWYTTSVICVISEFLYVSDFRIPTFSIKHVLSSSSIRIKVFFYLFQILIVFLFQWHKLLFSQLSPYIFFIFI